MRLPGGGDCPTYLCYPLIILVVLADNEDSEE
eukprot:CAMPEP_0184305388 /NCGR_PEP_ID=MMETSP1049-20130417/14684_1 /TAXON_ID=77928 /ORGANISM="Proteomonas sulcata, Strain CCMP704" /LENGTH=31 /DNA_ID= /DNA_START= /DNA_END= /DNA_ORIENTATION=